MKGSVTMPWHHCEENVTARFEYDPSCKSGVCYGCRKVVDLTQPQTEVSNVIWTYSQLRRLIKQTHHQDEAE